MFGFQGSSCNATFSGRCALVGMLGLTASACLFAFSHLMTLIQNKEAISRTQEWVIELETVLAILENADACERGYAVSAQSELLDKLSDAGPELEAHLKRLEMLCGNDGMRRQGVADLKRLAFDRLSMPAPKASEPGDLSAIATSLSKKQLLMDDIRQSVSALEEFGYRALDAYTAHSAVLARQAAAAIAVLLFAVASLAILVGFLVQSYWRERRRGLELIAAGARVEKRLAMEILEHAPIGFARLDPALRIQEVNATFARLSGDTYGGDGLVGRGLEEVLPWLAREIEARILHEGGSLDLQNCSIEVKNGSDRKRTRWNLAAWPVKAGRKSTTSIVLLANEVSERARLLEEREDVYATIAHDLKVPLVGMYRALSLLDDGSFGTLSETQASFIGVMKRGHRDLLTLVERLVDIHRFEADRNCLKIDYFYLAPLVMDHVATMQLIARDRGLLVEVDIEPELLVAADRLALGRVIKNLLDNAIKFSMENTTINIAAEHNDGRVTIKVTNRGDVIPSESLKMIFHRFWRSVDSKRRANGSGLGLYLCKRIVEAHDGDIVCESSAEATTFTVTLPTDLSAVEASPVAAAQPVVLLGAAVCVQEAK